jgi:hypothetical protein
MTIYAILAAEFVYRYLKRKPIREPERAGHLVLEDTDRIPSDSSHSTASGLEKAKGDDQTTNIIKKRVKIMSVALIATTVLIYIR